MAPTLRLFCFSPNRRIALSVVAALSYQNRFAILLKCSRPLDSDVKLSRDMDDPIAFSSLCYGTSAKLRCQKFPVILPEQLRCALLLEMLFVRRIVLRKTASHFCWKCSLSDALSCAKALHTFAGNALCPTHCPAQKRVTLLLEMLFVRRIVLRKTASHFCWKCFKPHWKSSSWGRFPTVTLSMFSRWKPMMMDGIIMNTRQNTGKPTTVITCCSAVRPRSPASTISMAATN